MLARRTDDFPADLSEPVAEAAACTSCLTSVFVTAVYFLLITGCRPHEAAFLIQAKKSFQPNDYPDFEGDWKATVPADFTKTRRPYKWDIPKYANSAVETLRALHKHVPTLQEQLGSWDKFTKALETWFDRVMKDAAKEGKDVATHDKAGAKYNMRSARCFRATEWVKLAREAELEGKRPPPNPL